MPGFPKSQEDLIDKLLAFIFDLFNTGLIKIYEKFVWQKTLCSFNSMVLEGWKLFSLE